MNDSEALLLLAAGREERPEPSLYHQTLQALRRTPEPARPLPLRIWPLLSGRSVLLSIGLVGVAVVLVVHVLTDVKPKRVDRALHAEPEQASQRGLGTPPEPSPPEPSPRRATVSAASASNRSVAVEPLQPAPPPASGAIQRSLARRRLPSSAELAARARARRDSRELAAAAAKDWDADDCMPRECTVVRPSDALLTDFEDVSPEGVFVDGDAFSARPDGWWRGFYGSTYVFPAGSTELSQLVHGAWRVRGTVRGWAGFGLWLGACSVDFSGYSGVSFELFGDVGPDSALTLYVDTDEDSRPERCRPNVGKCQGESDECVSPSKRLSIPSRPGKPVVVRFGELSGGRPLSAPDPARILQIRWTFDAPGSRSGLSAYPVDVTVDNVRLVP